MICVASWMINDTGETIIFVFDIYICLFDEQCKYFFREKNNNKKQKNKTCHKY